MNCPDCSLPLPDVPHVHVCPALTQKPTNPKDAIGITKMPIVSSASCNVYLAGPMTGLPNFNFPAFDYAAKKLREQGYVVFSPAERDRKVYGDVIEDNKTGNIAEAVAKAKFNAAETMEADTRWICRHATAIALLPGWEKSKGVGVELALARYLGLTVIELGSEYTKNG